MNRLPPLPHPYDGMLSADGGGVIDGYTANQMRAYAQEAIKQERRLVAAEVRQFLDRRCLRVER